MDKKRVAIYIRVSTIEQASEGYSIGEQTERCKKYCEAMDYTPVKIYTDPGFSGSNVDRPAMQELIKDCKNNLFDVILVYKLDRLSRSQKDTLYLIEDVFLKNNLAFVSMSENFDTGSPFGRAMIGILSVFAQLEREQIKERMTMGRIGAAKAGKWRGGSGIPIGYDYISGNDGILTVNEYESAQVQELFKLWLDGKSSHQICKIFQDKGYQNKYGKWSYAGSIPLIISNPIYIGLQQYAGEIYPGLQKPIIDEETFNKAQNELKRRRQNLTSNQRTAWRGKKMLTGLLYCGNCGARYFCVNTTKKNKYGESESYHYYKCYTRDGNAEMKTSDYCKNKTWKREQLESIVLSEVKGLAMDKHKLKNLIPKSESVNDILLHKRISEIDKQIKSLLDLYQIENAPIEEIGKRISKLQSEKENLQKTIKSQNKKAPTTKIEDAKKTLDNAIDIINDGNEAQIKLLLSQLIDKIIVTGEDINIIWSFI